MTGTDIVQVLKQQILREPDVCKQAPLRDAAFEIEYLRAQVEFLLARVPPSEASQLSCPCEYFCCHGGRVRAAR